MADFIVEFTILEDDNATNKKEQWTIQTDGSSAQKREGVGIIIVTPTEKCSSTKSENGGKEMNPKNPKNQNKQKKEKEKSETEHNLYLCHKKKGRRKAYLKKA